MQFNHISLIQQAKSLIFVGRNYTKTTIVFPALQNFLINCAFFRSGSQGSRPGRKKPKYDKLVGKKFYLEVLLLCFFGMALPTADVYSDGALIVQLSESHPRFATVLSIPVLLSFILLIPHWLKVEKTSERRLKTLILLLLQVWPQYRVLKLLIVLFQDREDQKKYHEKKAKHDKDITCIGKAITVYL